MESYSNYNSRKIVAVRKQSILSYRVVSKKVSNMCACMCICACFYLEKNVRKWNNEDQSEVLSF